jgi:hypothetical protein
VVLRHSVSSSTKICSDEKSFDGRCEKRDHWNKPNRNAGSGCLRFSVLRWEKGFAFAFLAG